MTLVRSSREHVVRAGHISSRIFFRKLRKSQCCSRSTVHTERAEFVAYRLRYDEFESVFLAGKSKQVSLHTSKVGFQLDLVCCRVSLDSVILFALCPCHSLE